MHLKKEKIGSERTFKLWKSKGAAWLIWSESKGVFHYSSANDGWKQAAMFR